MFEAPTESPSVQACWILDRKRHRPKQEPEMGKILVLATSGQHCDGSRQEIHRAPWELEVMLSAKRLAAEHASADSAKRPRIATHRSEENKQTGVQMDEELHSRQIAVYGRETMKLLVGSNVLISGIGGLGAEIAKNLALAGVKSITLHDERNVDARDLSSNFLVTEEDVGLNRAVASMPKLKDLNSSVSIFAWTSKLFKEELSKFQAVVFTQINFGEALEFDDYCHQHNPPIPFIMSDIRGLFGFAFCDFGQNFTVYDVDGEEPHTGYITYISNENPAQIHCLDDEKLQFQDGDFVVFKEIEGMTELNDGKPRRIKDVKNTSFILEEDTSNFGPYKKGGIVTEKKMPKQLNFKPLKDALVHPGEFLFSDYSKVDRPSLLHLAFRSLDRFVTQHGRFPESLSKKDASLLISLAKSINDEAVDSQKVDTIDENILIQFCTGSYAVLNPMAALFGGIVGQEVAKACTGKFHPLFQFFYFDSLESLPTQIPSQEDVETMNSRYDAQISIFGQDIQKKLQNLNIFLVGAGALGCEFLKNLALMGACCGSEGSLTVTDDDIIEKSNLTRQLLFRDSNIGQAKAIVAASATKSINYNVNIKAAQLRASPETENVFNEAFWRGLNLVIAALDSVPARLYIDKKCIFHEKPFLESGTLGTKCSTQVIIPHVTENYGASHDPTEKELPTCSVHSFPHTIDHCFAWARSEFEGMLDTVPSEANLLLSDRDVSKRSGKNAHELKQILNILATERCQTFEDCVKWSLHKFRKLFYEPVKSLIEQFPEDAKTQNGGYFWASPKRFPKPQEFDPSDPTNLSFVESASILRAHLYGITVPDWASQPEKLSKILAKLQVELSENIIKSDLETSEDSEHFIRMLETEISRISADYRLNPIHFDKDDHLHMELMASLANLRARSYSIPEVDKLKAKLIAGRIVPAIATTTAVAAALVCLELYKLLSTHDIERYRNTFGNLALPLFSMAEPVPPKKLRYTDESWTVWDKWHVEGVSTMQQLLHWFKEKGLTVYSISFNGAPIYSSMLNKNIKRLGRNDERLGMKLTRLIRNLTGIRTNSVVFSVNCFDSSMEDVDVPLVVVSL